MRVGNVAHGAGAALGWLVGQAVLARARVPLLAGLSVLTIGLACATQYMPWNGRYAWHQGLACIKRGDRAGALYWFEKAARAHPHEEGLREFIKWLRTEPPPEVNPKPDADN
jgi:hypothetical protein